MSVNWQNNEFYRGLIDSQRETGLSVADQNRIANPFGNHSFIGVAAVQLLPQLLSFGAEKFGEKLGSSGNTGSATDVTEQTNLSSKIKDATASFKNALSSRDTELAKTHLNTLRDLALNNDSKAARDAYRTAKDSLKAHDKSS